MKTRQLHNGVVHDADKHPATPVTFQTTSFLGSILILIWGVHLATAQPITNTPPNFDIGDISPQVIWHGQTADFYVRSDELGSAAAFTFSATPPPAGAMALDPTTGHFTYTPSLQDKEHFTVTIQASKAGYQPVWQVVDFEPMPHLPAEQEVLGFAPVHPLPDSAGTDYIIRTEVLSDSTESFNYVTRQTRTVSISGKTVILEQGNANGLYDSYNGSDDIKAFNVYAETLVLRDALQLPQTTVTIYAHELRFEDRALPAAKASIITTPRTLATLPTQFQNGQNGLRGGEFTAYLQSVYSDSGYSPRIIVAGGAGQAGGMGSPGSSGRDMVTCSGWPPYNDECFYPTNTLYEAVNDWYTFGPPGVVWSWDSFVWPGDGGPALVGGASGGGGDGGSVQANSSLSALCVLSGGPCGPATVTPGGRGGLPNPAFAIWVNRSDHDGSLIGVDIYQLHTSQPGPDAVSPLSAAGVAGTSSEVGHQLSWLTPMGVRMVVAYARDAYLYGYFDAVRANLEPYRGYLSNYQARAEWNALPQQWQLEFQQLQNEMDAMLYRLDSHLDYFGNPAGWVPMLSFEVNKLAFEGEIERAIRVLYLDYWVGHAASSLVQKSNAMASARQNLKDEIDGYITQYNANVQLVPVLQSESVTVSNQLREAEATLEALEQQLIAQAQQIVEERHKPPDQPWWKKVAKVAGAALQASPWGQPIIGTIGKGLDVIANFDSSDPWSSIGQLGSLAGEFTKTNIGKSVTDLKTQLDRIDFHTIETNNPLANVKTLFELAKPISAGVKALEDQQKATEAPKTEVEAELKQLEAGSPAFQGLVSEVTELNTDMELLGRRITAALQDISSSSAGITHDTLAIDGLNRGLAEGNAIIDHRAMVYLAEMDKRARARLLQYHYYMAKAYEYRLLRAYPGELNLQLLFDRFAQIVQAGSGSDLTASDFDALKAIYEDQLSTITADIFTIYNSNPPGLSAPLRFNFSPEQIRNLNAGQSVTINLKDIGLFQPTEEDVRIVSLQVSSLSAHVQGPMPSSFGYLDVKMEHSGESKLSSGGHDYLFRHYNPLTANPITWSTRYDALDNQIDHVAPSAANESMLAALLSREGIAQTTENLLLYSRPGAWADIVVTKAVNTDNGSDIVLDDLRLEVIYDFVPKSPDRAVFEVLAPTSGLLPYIIVDTADLNGRQDGRGGFRRNYSHGQALSLKAPLVYGGYRFAKWTDQYGTDIGSQPTSRDLQLTLNSTAVVRPTYLFEPYLYPSNGLTCLAAATNGTIQLTTGPNDSWTATTDVPWITITSPSTGTNGGFIDYAVAPSSDCSSRTGHILVAGLSFAVSQAAGTAQYALSATNATIPAAGGNGNVTLATGAGCPWTAYQDVAWVSLTSPASGSGAGSVSYSVAANPDCLSRTGTITIAGVAFSVNQSGGAGSFSLAPTESQHLSTGGTGTIAIQCGIGCPWTATKNAEWISFTSADTGAGAASLSYAVAPNADCLSRTGIVTIAGQPFTIKQAAGAGAYSLSASEAHFDWTGGTSSATLNCGNGCQWGASTTVGWILLIPPTNGTGPALITFAVPTNSDTHARTGTVNVAGQLLTVTQGGATSYVPNDNFENRTPIAGTSAVVHASSTLATKQPGEPNHAGNVGGRSVWLTWPAPGDGDLTLSTLGSSFDTELAAYTGTSVSNLTSIASNDDASATEFTSRVTFNALAGTQYQIAVDGFDGAGGDITLTLSFASYPPRIRPPRIETNGLLGFFFSAMPDKTNYAVQVSTNLVNWKPLSPIVSTNPLIPFTDPRSTNYPSRFYRVLVQ